MTVNNDTMVTVDIPADKLLDADSCGFQAECTPEEAEAMGAFSEDALDVDDALDGAADLAALDADVSG
ncbi:MAG: conjugal transfer protein TraD [Planctomycetota bacterium]|jgi:hypothetical protein|nr:conjugal transfer protein TraD [Planctomycetota bacterium]